MYARRLMASVVRATESAAQGAQRLASSSAPPKVVAAELVALDYNDLVAGKDLTKDIERGAAEPRTRLLLLSIFSKDKSCSFSSCTAFSYEGLGILTVVNVPTLAEKRQALLPLARTFAELPTEVKQR